MRNCVWSIATASVSRAGSARLYSAFMALSPIGSQTLATAILDQRAGTQDLSLMDLSTDRTAPLTTTRGYTGNPVWSADGKSWPTPTSLRAGSTTRT